MGVKKNIDVENVTGEIFVMKPAYPMYMTEAMRLKSFQGWPSNRTQTPQELADAGFFFTQNDDETICFHCGGGLKSWEKNEMPWIEHARWFNRCLYIRVVKGEDFIRKVISGTIHTLSSSKDQADSFQDSSKNICKLCYSKPYEICFVPCGHVMACTKCSMSVESCPVCRTEFTSLVKLMF